MCGSTPCVPFAPTSVLPSTHWDRATCPSPTAGTAGHAYFPVPGARTDPTRRHPWQRPTARTHHTTSMVLLVRRLAFQLLSRFAAPCLSYTAAEMLPPALPRAPRRTNEAAMRRPPPPPPSASRSPAPLRRFARRLAASYGLPSRGTSHAAHVLPPPLMRAQAPPQRPQRAPRLQQWQRRLASQRGWGQRRRAPAPPPARRARGAAACRGRGCARGGACCPCGPRRRRRPSRPSPVTTTAKEATCQELVQAAVYGFVLAHDLSTFARQHPVEMVC